MKTRRRDHGRQEDRDRGVAPAPAPEPLAAGRSPGQDRPIGQEAAQVLGQGAGRGITLGRVPGHRLQADRLQVAGDVAVELLRRDGRAGHDLADQPRLVHRFERRPESQQLVERDAQAVDIAAVVGPAVELLGGHEAECPHDVPGRGQVLEPASFARPKSATHAVPARSMRTFEGLMSRWRIPCSWA